MELNRRRFGKIALVFCAACATGAWQWFRSTPRRVVQALREGRFPGTVHPLNEDDVQRPGRWAG